MGNTYLPFPFLWQFYQVHHSKATIDGKHFIQAHENTSGDAFGGFNPIEQAFIVHFFAISIGHLNHANIKLPGGPCATSSTIHYHLYHRPCATGREIWCKLWH